MISVVVAPHHLAGVHRDAEPGLADALALLLGQNARKALCISTAARTARIASSSATRGAPNTAFTPSPISCVTRAAVRLDGAAHRGVVALHELADGLGVEAFVQGCRADQVGEDDGDDLASDGGVGRAGGQGRAARRAEASVGRALGAARRAARREGGPAARAEAVAGFRRPSAARADHGRPSAPAHTTISTLPRREPGYQPCSWRLPANVKDFTAPPERKG